CSRAVRRSSGSAIGAGHCARRPAPSSGPRWPPPARLHAPLTCPPRRHPPPRAVAPPPGPPPAAANLPASSTPALVAQGIEHRPPEPCAQVRILPRAHQIALLPQRGEHTAHLESLVPRSEAAPDAATVAAFMRCLPSVHRAFRFVRVGGGQRGFITT